MKKQILTILISLLLTNIAFAIPNYSFDPKMGKTSFETKGWPSLIVIKGEGLGAKGELVEKDQKLSGTLTMDLNSFKTGIGLRDSHMKDNYLQTKEYPTATINIKELALPKDKKGDVAFTGELELHGVKKSIKGKAVLEPQGKVVSVKAEFPITLSDFKIDIPSYKGITVAEKVKVKFESKVTTK